MINMTNKFMNNLNKLYYYIINEKYNNKSKYYNCMIELIIILKKTVLEITNIYTKYILLPKLQNIY